MGCSSRIFNDKNCTNYAAPRDTDWLRTLLQNRLWRERAVEMGERTWLAGLDDTNILLVLFNLLSASQRSCSASWLSCLRVRSRILFSAFSSGFYWQINLDGIVMNSDGIMMNNVHATVSGIFPQEDYVGAVPLMFAAKGGSIEAAELLVSRLKWRLWGLSCCGLDEHIKYEPLQYHLQCHSFIVTQLGMLVSVKYPSATYVYPCCTRM